MNHITAPRSGGSVLSGSTRLARHARWRGADGSLDLTRTTPQNGACRADLVRASRDHYRGSSRRPPPWRRRAQVAFIEVRYVWGSGGGIEGGQTGSSGRQERYRRTCGDGRCATAGRKGAKPGQCSALVLRGRGAVAIERPRSKASRRSAERAVLPRNYPSWTRPTHARDGRQRQARDIEPSRAGGAFQPERSIRRAFAVSPLAHSGQNFRRWCCGRAISSGHQACWGVRSAATPIRTSASGPPAHPLHQAAPPVRWATDRTGELCGRSPQVSG